MVNVFFTWDFPLKAEMISHGAAPPPLSSNLDTYNPGKINENDVVFWVLFLLLVLGRSQLAQEHVSRLQHNEMASQSLALSLSRL